MENGDSIDAREAPRRLPTKDCLDGAPSTKSSVQIKTKVPGKRPTMAQPRQEKQMEGWVVGWSYSQRKKIDERQPAQTPPRGPRKVNPKPPQRDSDREPGSTGRRSHPSRVKISSPTALAPNGSQTGERKTRAFALFDRPMPRIDCWDQRDQPNEPEQQSGATGSTSRPPHIAPAWEATE